MLTSNWSGVKAKIGSCISFSILNVAIKSAALPVLWIVFLQDLGALLWACVCFGFTVKRSTFSPLSVLRAFFSLSGMMLWTLSLKHFSLFQTISIGLFSPCATVLLAIFILREKLTWMRALAISLSIFGGVLVQCGKSPFTTEWFTIFEFNTFPFYTFLSMFCFSASNIIAKKMLERTSPEEVGFSLFALTAFGAGMLIFIGYFLDASFVEFKTVLNNNTIFWKDCIVLGSITFLSHILMNRALFVRQILFLLPFGAVRPILSTWFGWYFFNEPWPTFWMWGGSIAMLLAMLLLSKE